jgi:Holliday junction resolvase-like predicted endonuclease
LVSLSCPERKGMSEKQLQREIIDFLKSRGAYVLKNDATYRQGVPDLSFWHSDLSGFIEVKADARSTYQPLQLATIKKLQDMGIFCEVISWDNWHDWIIKLDQWLEG